MERHFVLIRLYRLGDLLMATALARAWKQEAPTQITWIVSEEFAPLLRGQPCLDRLIAVPRRFVLRYLRRSHWQDQQAPLAEAIRLFPRVFEALPDQADRVVNLQYSLAGLLLAGQIQTKERYGPYIDPDGFQRVDDLWSQYYLASGADLRFSAVHWVDAFLNIGKASRKNAQTRYVARPAESFRRRFQMACGGRPYFVVQMGAFEDQKCWPAERYLEAIVEIVRETGWLPVLIGSRTERLTTLRTVRALAERGIAALSLAGETGFDELAVVLENAAVVLGNDSFAQHFAAALDRPAVTVYQGSPSPWLTLAYREGNRAVAEDDGSAPAVERVVGAVLGTRSDYLLAQRLNDYQFPWPAGPEAQTTGWKQRWIVGTGHLRVLDPQFSAGPEVRVSFPRGWLEAIDQVLEELRRGTAELPPRLDAALVRAGREHPLHALLVVGVVKNRFSSLDTHTTDEYIRNYSWLREALLRAGVPV